MDFWLDTLIRRSRIPYPAFFSMVAILLYLSCIPVMIQTGNLQHFLSDLRWILITIFGAYNGILIIFIYRRFSESLDKIRHLIDDDYRRVKNRSLSRLLNKAYWILVAFWLFMNALVFEKGVQKWFWGSVYDRPQIVSGCYFVSTLPHMIIIGILFYLVFIGLPLATRELSQNTPFKLDQIVTEWMAPFNGFKKLSTILMFGAAVYAVFPPNIWSSVSEPSIGSQWVTISANAPYIGAAGLLLAIVIPHYFFHKLFHKSKKTRLLHLRDELSKVPNRQIEDNVKRILLMLEEEKVGRMKTWLIDIEVLGEVLVVALMHVILVEALSLIIHG